MLELAAHLGMTAGRVLREMTVREFAMWRIEYAARPWGERRADLRMGLWCALYANAHRDPKKRSEPYKPTDFLLFEEQPDEEAEQKPKDIVAPDTKAWFYAMAKRAKRNGKFGR